MATTTSHNKKSSAVKRILSEAREFSDNDTEFTANPLEDNIFEWHFTLRGPSCSEFQEGIYHGRIMLPAEYPFRPPDVMLMTPNGRWELNKKICLTFTGFHEEMWQPAWGIRTALIGVQAFMAARAEAAVGVGSLDYPEEEREKLAKRSQDWTCPVCKVKNSEILADNGTRMTEELPDGLTIDTRGDSKKGKEEEVAQGGNAASSILPQAPAPAPVSRQNEISSTILSEHSFGPSGPSDALMASLVNGQAGRDASLQNASITSSCVTSGTTTPLTSNLPASGRHISQDKGKQRQTQTSESEAESPSIDDAATTTSTITSMAAGSTSIRGGSPSTPLHTPPTARPAPQNTAESERKLAVFDRAIATVLFLLLALVLRRVLNAIS